MTLFYLLQTPTPAITPLAHETLERGPALLSLVFVGGLGLMVVFLLLSLARNRNQVSGLKAVAADDLPEEVRRKLGATAIAGRGRNGPPQTASRATQLR